LHKLTLTIIIVVSVSGTPRRQSSEPRKDVVIEDLLCSQITSDGDSRYEMRSADGGYPTNATSTPLSGCDVNSKHFVSLLLLFWRCEMRFTGD
jgi:hypothetical protein